MVHRDIGYVAVALTLAYGLSGIAVNHIDDWNPNYSYAEHAVDIGALPAGSLVEKEAYVVTKLGIDRRQVRGHFQETATDLRVFLVEGQEARVDMATGPRHAQDDHEARCILRGQRAPPQQPQGHLDLRCRHLRARAHDSRAHRYDDDEG